MQLIWDFFSGQILGMKWLNDLIGMLLTTLGVDITEGIGASLQFFIYDTIKILWLLSVLIFIISYIQSYFPPEKTKQILGKYKGISANLMGALLGTVTPFCSCSSIPIFIGFTNAGFPVGVTFSFLISSPLVDLGAFVLLMGVFGGKVAIAYVVVGIILAVISGTLIDKLGLKKYVEQYIKQAENVKIEVSDLTPKDRFSYAKEQMWATLKKVFFYVILGVGIGTLIHHWIPQHWIESVLGVNNPFSVLLATVVGIPMYSDIFGTIPIAESLFAKGVGIGTILSFMMAVTALSLPSMIMLRKAVQPKLLVIFVSIVSVGIILIGYLFNTFSFLML